MSALDKLIIQQLSKSLPPEAAKFLTPEGLNFIGSEIGRLVAFHHNSMNTMIEQQKLIIAQNNVIMKALNLELEVTKEDIENVGTSGADTTGGGSGSGFSLVAA